MSAAATLRARTATLHAEVDAAFGGFRLDQADSYRLLLLAHARALPAIEAALAVFTDLPLGPNRTALLTHDLAALGAAPPPPLPFELADKSRAWGALYVVEGSRLGGALLARSVGHELPRAYLDAGFGPGGWARLREQIDIAARQCAIGAMVNGARAAFALYRAAIRGAESGR